jgi:hypothetical protein
LEKKENMNIFFLHLLPDICAQMHIDKHVIKMILETAQLLCSAHYLSESDYKPCYKLTHKNHPSAIWTRESKGNYQWLCSLGQELCKEYTYRYGKIHKCQPYIEDLAKNVPNLPDIGFTPPRLAMPVMSKDEDFIEAYRTYYFFDKMYIHSWKGKVGGRETPEWIVDMHKLFNDPVNM